MSGYKVTGTHTLTESYGESKELRAYNALPEATEEFLEKYLTETCEETITSQVQFPDPFLFKGMTEAVNLFIWAVRNQKRILCVSDSDADGVGTFMVFTEFFKAFNYTNVEYIIVKRHEGYGFIPKNITDRQIKPDLVITADNGITGHAGVDLCNQMGIFTIITDHHQVNHKGVPKATAVIDPHQPGCMFPLKDINGTFVLWYFFKGVMNTMQLPFRDYWFDMMIAELTLTTISDVMPLKHINRFIVKYGLPKFFWSPRNWVKAFVEGKQELTAEDLSFGLIPSINAAARLADALDAANYLFSPDYGVAKQWLSYLQNLNENRKQRQEALDVEIGSNYADWLDKPFIIVPGRGERFHKGILGPCSGRVAEKFNKPSIIMTLSHDGKYYSGSGRSVGEIDLLGIVKSSSNIDLDKSGGHKVACGVTVPVEKFQAFWYDIQAATQDIPKEAYRPKLVAIAKLPISLVSDEIYLLIKKFEPFGEGYQKPAFVAEGFFKEVKLIGKLKNHMKGVIEDGFGGKINFMWFFFNEPIKSGEKRKFMYQIAKDDFASEKSKQLEICIHIKTIISNI